MAAFRGLKNLFYILSLCLGLASCAGVPHDTFTQAFPSRDIAMREGEDINGSFPEAVYIKTRTQTFNTYHYYILKEGFIWYKSTDSEKEPKNWALFTGTGLPHNPAKKDFANPSCIVEISADADELMALSSDGYFYRICFDWIFSRKKTVWFDSQGWPSEIRLFFDERTAGNRAWALGKRNNQVGYYEDPFGNQHHNGTQEIATTYVLLEDGQEISYADTGLPSDFSRNYLGPERGAFRAVALSASASTIFLINDAGEMYTRIADFDIVGGDPMFMKYTYEPYISAIPGISYYSNLTPWGLPPEDWRIQEPIPLEGRAALTRHITILQNGQGNAARELRVAGYNAGGETGYWSKALYGTEWSFVRVPLFFAPEALLPAPGSREDIGERGPATDKSYSGFMWRDDSRADDFTYEIPDFNILEGRCSLRITRGEESCAITIHPVELWTYIRRDYLPGRTGLPKIFFATLDIPENAFDGLSREFAEALEEKFRDRDKALFRYVIEASPDYVLLRGDGGEAFFLTGENLSNYFPEFHRTWIFRDYDEIERYNALRISGGPEFTRENYAELRHKISLNGNFIRELENRIAEYESLRKSAFRSGIAYTAADFISHITLLNFIDIPKIATITSFGKEIFSVNRAYTTMISDTRIWIDSKLLELLRIRVSVYTGLADELAAGAEQVFLPPEYAETFSGYWEAAGLPSQVSGYFSLHRQVLPARLSVSDDNVGFFGLVISVGNDPDFDLFVDPINAPQIIFSRREAGERTYTFRGRLYVEKVADRDSSRKLFEDNIVPYIAGNKGIEVTVAFDGEELVIKATRPFRRALTIFSVRVR
ncbi:MAG: hypothetical protein LBK40_05985 [Spirochaetaceae bacterium]|nr:hypothetical protein [Spirochaetaceae bacterium]